MMEGYKPIFDGRYCGRIRHDPFGRSILVEGCPCMMEVGGPKFWCLRYVRRDLKPHVLRESRERIVRCKECVERAGA